MAESSPPSTAYSIHDIVSVQADTDVPIPDRFMVDDLEEPPDLSITCGELDVDIERRNMTRCNIFFFGRSDSTFLIDYQVPLIDVRVAIHDLQSETEIRCTPAFRRFGDLTNLINTILLFKLLQKGYTFVHAGCVNRDGACTLVAGMRDTGKTSTVLSIVDGEETRFMSDDLTIIGEDGSAYGYPTSVGISPFTLTGETMEYTGGRVRKWIANHQLVLLFVQDILGHEISERKHVSEWALAHEGQIQNMFVLGGGGKKGAHTLPKRAAANKLLMTTAELIDPFRIYSLNFYAFYTGFDSASLFVRQREIIERALDGVDCDELRANDIREYPALIKQRS